MYRALKVLASCGVLLAAGCGDSSQMSTDLQNDLALASVSADLELASRATDETRVVGTVERTNPPSRAISSSARAPRPRRSPRPQVAAAVQEQAEIVEEPEVAAVEQPMPEPVPEEEVPVVIAASTRPRAIEPASGGAGPSDRGTDWGTIIGIAGAVVVRGGGVGEDRCIPPTVVRGGTSISINERYPTRRSSGRPMIGSQSSGRTSGRPMIGSGSGSSGRAKAAPSRPRDTGSLRPMQTASMRRMSGGGGTVGGESRAGSSAVAVQ